MPASEMDGIVAHTQQHTHSMTGAWVLQGRIVPASEMDGIIAEYDKDGDGRIDAVREQCACVRACARVCVCVQLN